MTEHAELTALDEDAAIEAAAALSLRDALKREDVTNATGRPRNIALETWGDEIEAEILAALSNRP